MKVTGFAWTRLKAVTWNARNKAFEGNVRAVFDCMLFAVSAGGASIICTSCTVSHLRSGLLFCYRVLSGTRYGIVSMSKAFRSVWATFRPSLKPYKKSFGSTVFQLEKHWQRVH